MKRCAVLASIAIVTTFAFGAVAEGIDATDVQRAQVERLRAEHANTLHLKAYDLLDELVLEWTKNPPFATDTSVALAEATGPFGYGSGLEALLENHLAELLLKHPETHVRLTHCPACSAISVHSDATGTVISKGVDQPALLNKLSGQGGMHALFVDFEAEGSSLVLRARIALLKDTLPLVYARTISSSTSSAALLRTSDHLVTAEEAKQEYLDALQQKGPIIIPIRTSVSRFAQPTDGASFAAPPFIWLQSGAEMSINHTRDWMGSLMVGGTWIPQLYTGLMLQARVYRLISGAAMSLTHPNVYLFGGAALEGIQGPAALLLRTQQPQLTDLLTALGNIQLPTEVFPAFHMGIDLRIGNRISVAAFAETMPTLNGALSVGRYLDFGVLQIHSLGGEVSLCF